MRSLLGGLTTRGKSFLTAGLVAVLCGLLLGEVQLLRLGMIIFLLPLLSALAAGRTRYRLSCQRQLSPSRVPAGQPVRVTVWIQNVARLPTGLLLAEDSAPYLLGTRARFVLDRIERGGSRELHYTVRSDVRGKFTLGPLRLRVADTFGLVELSRSFSSRSTLIVSPRVIQLPGTARPASWLGDGEGRSKAAPGAGEDDPAPRPYRQGDELRRVHWRSTARYGELMVRREEQQWRNRAVLLLDTRRGSHAGSGQTSSFEVAVSAAASIGLHLAGQSISGQLVTDAGLINGPGTFEDVLLDALAVIKPSAATSLAPGLAAVAHQPSGLIVAVMGGLRTAQARSLAESRKPGSAALALLLAVSCWETGAPPGDADGTEAARQILEAAGWRVATLRADTPLPAAWQQLHEQPLARPPGAITGLVTGAAV